MNRKTFDIFIVRRQDDVDLSQLQTKTEVSVIATSRRLHDKTEDLIDKIFLDIFKFCLFLFLNKTRNLESNFDK